MINVFLSSKNAEIRGNMVGYVNQYDEGSTSRIAGLTQNFLSKGFSQEQAQALAMKTMDGMVFKQQAIVSYNQGFFMVAIIILFCIPIVLLIKYKKQAKPAVVSDH